MSSFYSITRPSSVSEINSRNLPKSESDHGFFSRLKKACISAASSQQSVKDAAPASANINTNFDPYDRMSKSTHDLTKENEEWLKELNAEVPASKSCSNLLCAFQDESDMDISHLLDARFARAVPKPSEQKTKTEET